MAGTRAARTSFPASASVARNSALVAVPGFINTPIPGWYYADFRGGLPRRTIPWARGGPAVYSRRIPAVYSRRAKWWTETMNVILFALRRPFTVMVALVAVAAAFVLALWRMDVDVFQQDQLNE